MNEDRSSTHLPSIREFKFLLIALRPHQWTKNLVVLAALIFAQKLFHWPSVIGATWAFLLFCVVSGAVYLLNDLVDLKKDRLHPVKRSRPIASGELSKQFSIFVGLILVFIGFFTAISLDIKFGITVIVYFFVMAAYCLVLKNIVIVDVLVVAMGFVLRAVAGAFAINVAVSNWLLVCTLLLALFLALSKRRHELTLLLDEAAEHRSILGEYSSYLLDQMIAVVSASTLVTYGLYASAPETVAKFGTDGLIWTLPFVLYGILRYLYLVHRKEKGGSPTLVLLNDKPILVTVTLWAATVITVIYHGNI